MRNRWVPIKYRGTLGPGAQNPRWRPEIVDDPPNFAPMALRAKILVANIGFSGTRKTLNTFSKVSARYFRWIRRFLAFSAVFKLFFYNMFIPMSSTAKFLVPIERFWCTGIMLKLFSKIFSRYFSWIWRFSLNFLRFSSIFQLFQLLWWLQSNFLCLSYGLWLLIKSRTYSQHISQFFKTEFGDFFAVFKNFI